MGYACTNQLHKTSHQGHHKWKVIPKLSTQYQIHTSRIYTIGIIRGETFILYRCKKYLNIKISPKPWIVSKIKKELSMYIKNYNIIYQLSNNVSMYVRSKASIRYINRVYIHPTVLSLSPHWGPEDPSGVQSSLFVSLSVCLYVSPSVSLSLRLSF